jgi:hypothetical protein
VQADAASRAPRDAQASCNTDAGGNPSFHSIAGFNASSLNAGGFNASARHIYPRGDCNAV